MVQKCTKCVKYAGCFPMGNFSFMCGTQEWNHQIKDELCGKNPFYLQRFRLQILSTEKNEQKEICSSMFSPRRYCRYRIYLGCVLFYSSFSQPCHTSPCWPPPMSAVASWSTFSQLCPVLAQAVRDWLPPGRSAPASVPELVVKTCCLANEMKNLSKIEFF